MVAHTHTHLSASATWFPVCEQLSVGHLVSWVNDPHILFFSYFTGHTSLNHLTHQHAQQVTKAMIAMTVADEMPTSKTSTEMQSRLVGKGTISLQTSRSYTCE